MPVWATAGTVIWTSQNFARPAFGSEPKNCTEHVPTESAVRVTQLEPSPKRTLRTAPVENASPSSARRTQAVTVPESVGPGRCRRTPAVSAVEVSDAAEATGATAATTVGGVAA